MAIFILHMFYFSMLKLNSVNFNNFSFGKRGAEKQTTKGKTGALQRPTSTLSYNPLAMQQFILKTKPYNPERLSIYYYNDTHGNSDQMTDLINNAKKFQERFKGTNDTSFILSAGDNCSGGDYKKNEFIFDLMQNIMGVDASAVGNHEIDATSEGFFNAAKDKNITFVATNVEFDETNKMKDFVKKSIIKEKNGVKYGFIGTMPIDFNMCTKKESQVGLNVFDFNHSVEALQKEIDNLKAQGVKRIIMLSHVGYETDKKLVEQLDGIDIVIGGHTHSVIKGAKENENIVKSKSGEPVIITQGGENGLYYGILNVEFDNNGILKKIENDLVETTNRSNNPVVEYIKVQHLGKSAHVGTIEKSEPLPANRRIESCGWSEMMADSMKEELGGDIAIINAANIRKVPHTGKITERDVTESAPMKNKLIKTKITQKQLVEAVSNAAKNTLTAPDGYPGLLIGSGFGYKVDDNGNLLELYIIDKKGNRTAVNIKNPSDKITYTVIYDNFASKKDGEYPELEPKFKCQEFDFDKDYTMCKYLSKLSNRENIIVKSDNRIEIIKTSQPKQKDNSSRKI